MLFDLHPKESIKELFGREKEVEFVISQLISGNWVIISGQREIGKTSLIKVVINELKKRRKIPGIYVNLRGIKSLNSLLSLMLAEINKGISWNFHVNVNFAITNAGIEIKKGSKVVNSLLELLLSSDEIVIGFDEVQELTSVSKQFLDILGNVYSSNPKVHLIFSGSYVGLVTSMLNPPSSSPLHSRPPVEVKLKPFNEETSLSFLKKGMEEVNVEFTHYEETVEKLDGIAGWLTLFGNLYAIRKINFNDALSQTVNEGKKIMIDEFNHFLSTKKNKELYCAIMEVLKVVNKWKEIKNGVEIKIGKIDDKEFSNALKNLVNFNFVTKEGEKYEITDPILKEISFKCNP
ncbi:ATP-binding protein [Sulfolobus tengchongensis]|uniref:ATP-binding protein n=1 Tax=Sulfolobus tengchongensis TaxID=207809 RepID=A0AAX4L3S3_9CREN